MQTFHHQGSRKAAPRGVDPVLSPVNDEDQDTNLYQDIIECLNRSELITDHLLVNVQSGIVFLRGAVSDGEDRTQVESLVADLPGVREVRNEIHLKT